MTPQSNTQANKKVLHAFYRMAYAGAEIRTLETIPILKRQGITTDTLSVSGQPGPLDDAIREQGGEAHLIKVGLKFPYRLYQLLKSEQYETVHSSLHLMAGPILFIAWLAGVPIRIVHYRTTDNGNQASLLKSAIRSLSKWFVRMFATNIISTSQAGLQFHAGKLATTDPRCEAIYDGIIPVGNLASSSHVRSEFQVPENMPLFVHVGNFRWQKNHDFLIDILEQYKQQYGDFRMLLVGDTSSNEEAQQLHQTIKQKIQTLQLDQQVLITGSRKDVPQLLSAADVMIFPSTNEGLPGAVLESLSAGTPVICSDHGPFAEIHQHAQGVFPANLKDSATQWAKTVHQAQKQQSPVQKQQILNAFLTTPFTVENHCRQIERLYGVSSPVQQTSHKSAA